MMMTLIKKESKEEQLSKFTVKHDGEKLTTNQGVVVSHTDDSLKAGERGPTLMEDFHFREKLTHFDHERIPERVVHARGFGAHGYFQVYESMKEFTKAKFLQDPSVKTPVFVRFSTVVGSRGSADTARDVRGFATKFYTEDGNYDLVGNNIPVFFIHDAIKFPDLVHSIKPEQHNEVPQASAAHDTFWDFISCMPETAGMIMWLLSDRSIPRSFRHMEGFGVNTFRLVNEEGKSRFVKFHWKPLLGTHPLVWDEAQKLQGKDPDFHRRDLWDAIENGDYPEYEFGVQMIEEEDEHNFDFDILDATKFWPEELIPVKIIGKMVLDRNVENFFAETEQVAFHPGHVVPGIDFTNDPLLQGRLFSYLDTQLIRLGGPNFAEIPINRPVAPVHNNQRDGYNRMTIDVGKEAYFPNSLRDNKPGPDPDHGYRHVEEKVEGRKIRERSEKFKDFYSQATLFWNSLSEREKARLVKTFHFEVGNVDDYDVRKRIVDMFNHVSEDLAKKIAVGVGVEPPSEPGGTGVTETSPSVSIENTVYTAKGRKVAILAENGFNYEDVDQVMEGLKKEGVTCEIVSTNKGMIKSADGRELKVTKSQVTTTSVKYDAVYVPGGRESVDNMKEQGYVLHFINEQYKHLKTIAASNEGIEIVQSSQIDRATNQDDPQSSGLHREGIVTVKDASDLSDFCKQFVESIAKHRHWDRQDDHSYVPG
jgi:catalase